MSTKPHVGVVGAGFSGLRCADILVQNGVRVTILEARDRIGGRVHQVEVGGRLVDLGPNWIHGTGENPIMSIAEATQTVTHDPEGRAIAIARDGHLLDDALTTKASEFMWSTIEQAFEYSKSHGQSIPPERSLFDFFQEKVEQTDFSEGEKELCLDACQLWGAYVGDPIQRQSLKFFCLEECLDGNNYFVASTYKHILAHVAQAAQTHAEIKFNQPVVRIEAPSRENSQPKDQHKVTVTTASGDEYQFDELVITCPLGWLKHHTEAFSPALPPRLLQAITNISYGRLEKIYITFPKAFWHDANTDATDPTTTRNPVFAQFLEPTYTTHPPSIPWNQECLSLSTLPPPCSQPTLLFYTYGPCATHIVNAIAPFPPSSREYNQTLTAALEPFYSRLPGYDAASPDCAPVSLLATAWQNDPYAGNGSYCNFQVGLTGADKDIEVLRSGCGVGGGRGLWFAGEHTAPFVALGTTTGAYWSGERAAVQVCEKFGLGRKGAGVLHDDSLP